MKLKRLLTLWAAIAHATSFAAPGELTFTTWGGTYAKAQMKAIVTPFSADTGVKVRVTEYAGGLEQLRHQRAVGQADWDVVDMTMADAVQACEEGLLERIDPATLEPGLQGERPSQDYVPGALTDCFAGTVVWSTVVVYDRKKFSDGEPKSIADFFDLKNFPGKRGLQKSAEGNLEWALMADGVPVDSVYTVLASPAGFERAIRKLDTIRSQIVWWDSGAQQLELISSGAVSMTSAYNGRVYAAMAMKDMPIRFMWDGQLLNIEGLAIVKGARNLEAARAFLRYATSPTPMAAMAPLMAYGPTRVSASRLIDPVMMHLLPTAPWYGKRSLMASDRSLWTLVGGPSTERGCVSASPRGPPACLDIQPRHCIVGPDLPSPAVPPGRKSWLKVTRCRMS